MEATTFFPGSGRRVTLGSPTLLVGKNKTRKIRLPIQMILSGEPITGCPDWLSEGYAAVAKGAVEYIPAIEQIPDVALRFSIPSSEAGGQLFEGREAKTPSAELKKFVACRTGDSEDPDVTLKFTTYMAYARDFWIWIGELAGEEVKLHFPSGKPSVEAVAPTQAPLIDDSVSTTEAEAFASSETVSGPGTPEFEEGVRQSMGAPEAAAEGTRMVSVRSPKPKKNGPRELAAYHAAHAN